MFIEPGDNSADGVIGHKASLHVGVEPFELANRINTSKPVVSHGLFGHNVHRLHLASAADVNVNGQDIADELVLRHRRSMLRGI